MGIFNGKKSVMFDALLSRTKEMNKSFDLGVRPQIQQNKLIRIIEGDEHSPLIMGLGENQHLIYYPKNSTPYLHQYEDSIKFVEILSGEIFDKLTGKIYTKGDRFKIYPDHKIQPYTKDHDCSVKVTVSKVDSIWEAVCN